MIYRGEEKNNFLLHCILLIQRPAYVDSKVQTEIFLNIFMFEQMTSPPYFRYTDLLAAEDSLCVGVFSFNWEFSFKWLPHTVTCRYYKKEQKHDHGWIHFRQVSHHWIDFRSSSLLIICTFSLRCTINFFRQNNSYVRSWQTLSIDSYSKVVTNPNIQVRKLLLWRFKQVIRQQLL